MIYETGLYTSSYYFMHLISQLILHWQMVHCVAANVDFTFLAGQPMGFFSYRIPLCQAASSFISMNGLLIQFYCQSEHGLILYVSLHDISVCLLQSKSSLDQMESQSADAEPPPPPKPELRYPGLPRADTEGETHTHTHTNT